MIEADFYESSGRLTLTVNGHAGYAPKGYDIVCAGVSALCAALVCQLEALEAKGTVQGLSFELGDGYFRCDVRQEDENAQDAMQAILFACRGIELIEAGFPAYVKLGNKPIM